MSVLRSRFRARRSPPATRPWLEPLEARTLLNHRFVVPAGVPLDNVNTFGTLQAALDTAGLVIGDAVQIEPGSAPGNVTSATPPVANLTIQGDPAAPLASIPMFTLSATLTVTTAQAGLTLRNVNVGLISVGAGAANNGSLLLNANATVTGCTLVDINSTATVLITLGGTTDVLTNTTVINDIATPPNQPVVGVVTPAGGSNNLIANNTFVTNAANTKAEFAYLMGMDVPVTDRVVNNTFVQNAGASLDFFLDVQESITGLVIQGNTFSGDHTNTGIIQFFNPQNLQIVGNTITLGGTSLAGISLAGGAAGTTTSATVRDNRVSAGGTGTGIRIRPGAAATSVLNLKIQGNDLHNNQIGVQFGAAAGPVGGVDLGGGTQGSLGGNNFRGFTAAATATAGAIVSALAAAQGTVHAQRNLFATGVSPATVVSDPGGNLDLANPLTGNAAFVAALFEGELRRAADTTSASDAGGLIAALNAASLTPAAAASAIARSAEALGVVVDGLYQKLLGRAADPTGRANFVNFLQHGGTLEAVANALVTSGEYAAAVGGTDFGFVQSLYTRLLGRQAANSEVDFWLSQLPPLGRAGVANAILFSAEFRGGAVRQFFGNTAAPAATVTSLLPALLHRTAAPPAADVTGFVNSGLDLLSIEVIFAQTGEYFTSG